MKLFLKIIIAIVFTVVLLPIIALFLPASVWQWGLDKALETQLDAEVVWNHPLEYRSGFQPLWTINELSITTQNDDSLSARVEHLSLELNLKTLRDRIFTIKNFEVSGLDARIKRSPQSDKAVKVPSDGQRVAVPDLEKQAFLVEISRLSISESQISYNDLEPIYINKIVIDESVDKHHNLRFDAAYLQYKLNADGVLPSAYQIISGETSPFDINFKSGAFKGGLSGEISLNEFDGVLSLRAENLESFSPLAQQKLPDIENIIINTKMVGVYSKLRVPSIEIDIQDEDFKANATGSIENLNALSGLDAQIDIDHISAQSLLEQFDITWPTETKVQGKISLSGSADKLAVELNEILAIGEDINARISGGSSDVFSANTGMFTVRAHSEDLSDVINLFVDKNKWQPFGAIDAEADLIAEGGVWRAELKNAQLTGLGKNAIASGSVTDVLKFKGINIDVEAAITSLNTLNSIPKVNLMDFGPIDATAKLVDGDAGVLLKLTDIKGQHNTDDSRADLVGVIGDLIKFDKVDLSMSAWVSGLDIIEPFTFYPLPALGDLRADGHLTRDNSPINIDVTNAKLEGEGVNASGSGRVYDTGHENRWVYEANVSASVDTLSRVEVFFEETAALSLPPIGPLYATTSVVGDSNKALDVMGSGEWKTSENKKLTVDYRYDNLVSSDRSLTGSIHGEIPDIGQLFSVDVDDAQIEVGRIQTQSEFSYQGGVLAVTDVDLKASGGALTGGVSGEFRDITHFKGLDGVIDIKISTDLTARILKRFGIDGFFTGGESTFVSQLSSDQKIQKLEGFNLKVGEDQVFGDIYVNRDNRLLLEGHVTVENFKVKDERSPDSDKNNPPKEFLFSRERIPFESLRQIDVDLEAKLNKFKASVLDLSNTEFNILAKKGNWQFEGKTLQDLGVLNFNFDASRNIPRLTSQVDSIGLSAGAFITEPGVNPKRLEIPLHVEWDLIADGVSIHEFAQSLRGEARFFGKNIYIGTRMLNLVAGDLTTELLGLLNQSKKNKVKKGTVYCIGAKSNIENGIVDFGNDLGLKTDSLILTGSGTVNLGTERINLGIRPTARKGLGVGGSTIVHFIGLGGTLTNPQIDQSAADNFRNALLGTLAVFTAGTSAVITGMLGRIGSDEDVCEHAYSGELGKNIEEAAARSTEPSAGENR